MNSNPAWRIAACGQRGRYFVDRQPERLAQNYPNLEKYAFLAPIGNPLHSLPGRSWDLCDPVRAGICPKHASVNVSFCRSAFSPETMCISLGLEAHSQSGIAMPSIIPRSTMSVCGHPLHAMLVPVPIVCFVATLVTATASGESHRLRREAFVAHYGRPK
jgi:hypothetical protein